MDWQPVSDSTPQTIQGRVRKESNTSSSVSTYDNNVPEVVTANGGVAVLDPAGPGLFYDVPLQNSNSIHVIGDDEVSQLTSMMSGRWDQESSGGSASGGGSSSSNTKRQQKSNNISEQAQVAARLHQIRDYIGQTSSVMERLQAAGTPQHIENWLRLADMLEGLRDSERKLSSILNTFNRLQGSENEEYFDNDEIQAGSVPKSGDVTTRRNELKMKVEESQRKLLELREQQAALLALKQKAQDQLKEARAAQGALLAAQDLRDEDQDCNDMEDHLQSLHNFYEIRNELAQLVGSGATSDSTSGEVTQLQNKLEELQTKKMQIDQMVARFDAASNLLANTATASNVEQNGRGDGDQTHGQTTEEKILELAMLKEQLSKMQSALNSLPKSGQNVSSNSSSVGAANLQNPQELDGSFDDEVITNSSLHYKQDNRAQAISQNHHNHNHQPQLQQSPASLAAVVAGISASVDNNRSTTPTVIVQQQLHAKSLKLQEAKARLHHLQELLNLVEEFREAGKPIPEKILHLLNSPNGPLDGEDNLDLEQQQQQQQQPLTQNHQPQSSSSSSSSSLLSLYPQINNTNNNSNNSGSNPASTTVHRDDVLQTSARSEISLQNLFQPAVTTSQSQRQLQQQPVVTAKHKNNVSKLCAKTQELEEWMKKDDDPMSCINTDVHSQQQQAGGYHSSGYNYQDTSTTSATWGGSPDYSSDDGGRSEEDNDQGEYHRKATSVSGNVVGVGGLGNGGGCNTSTTTAAALANMTVINSKDQQLSTSSCGAPNYANITRELSDTGVGNSIPGNVIPQNCSASIQTPCNMWRKHSTGSGSSLPAHPIGNRGTVAPPRSTWTPTCRCCKRQESNVCSGPNDDGVPNLNSHQSVDNNTNWIVHQISQLQSQLQQMCQTMANKYNQGLLMTLPHNLWMPPPSVSSPFYQPCGTPPLQTPPVGTASGLNPYFGAQQQQQQQQQQQYHILLSSLNQCCQLIWHQQCELATLKESFQNMQQQQQHLQYQVPSHCNTGASVPLPSVHAVDSNVTDTMGEQSNSHSNLGRFTSSQPRNRSANASTSSPSSPQPPVMSLPPPHYFYPPYGNNLNLSFQPFQHSSPVGSFIPSPTGTLNNQVPPGNRANNYWDNFRSYSRQNLLSVRSKCNEGRSSLSGAAAIDSNIAPTDRSRISTNRQSRETLPGASNGNIASGGACSSISMQQPQQHHQPTNSALLDEMMTHNLPNLKEKLNTYQSHPELFQPTICVNNRSQPPSSSASASLTALQLSSEQNPHRQQKQQQLVTSVTSSTSKSAHDNSSSFKCDTSKGACKKSCKLKDQSHGSYNRGGSGLSEHLNNTNSNINSNSNPNNCTATITTSSVAPTTISSNNNFNNNSNRFWNCNNGNFGSHGDCSVELNPINNKQFQQQQQQQQQLHLGATGNSAVEDLPRNSNCKRRLMSNVAPTSNSKCNSNPLAFRVESNDWLDSLEESMYSEVAALISVNEQRPSYLLQLFKDLKQINSDPDRQAALYTIHNLASRSTGATANTVSSQFSNDDQQQQQQTGNVSFKTGSTPDDSIRVENESCNEYVNDNTNDDARYRKQPRNISWRCTKDTSALSSVLPTNCRKLDWEVRSILVDMLPFLKLHLSETCSPVLLESVRNLVLQLVPTTQNIPGQLDALLEDALFKFQGCRLRDICDELVTVVADVLISELTFLRLTTSVNGSVTDASHTNEDGDFCVVDDEDDECAVEEEGAVGGVNQAHNHPSLKPPSNQHLISDQIVRCSKTDPVVSDAELAEADQSSRHPEPNNSTTNCIGQLVMTSASTITDSESCNTRTSAEDDRNHSRSEGVDDILLTMGPVAVDNSDNIESSSQSKKSNTNPNTASSSSCLSNAGSLCNNVDIWAVEEDQDQHLDHIPTRLNFTNSVNGSDECEQQQQLFYSNNEIANNSSAAASSGNTSDGSHTVAAV